MSWVQFRRYFIFGSLLNALIELELARILFSSGKMTSNKPVDKLADNLKGLIIGASGPIPGYQHGMLFLKSKRSHTQRYRERDSSYASFDE